MSVAVLSVCFPQPMGPWCGQTLTLSGKPVRPQQLNSRKKGVRTLVFDVSIIGSQSFKCSVLSAHRTIFVQVPVEKPEGFATLRIAVI